MLYPTYHFIPALSEYQPEVYSTLLFFSTTQTCYSEAENELEYFSMVF
jgi:hypothetical protein